MESCYGQIFCNCTDKKLMLTTTLLKSLETLLICCQVQKAFCFDLTQNLTYLLYFYIFINGWESGKRLSFEQIFHNLVRILKQSTHSASDSLVFIGLTFRLTSKYQEVRPSPNENNNWVIFRLRFLYIPLI